MKDSDNRLIVDRKLLEKNIFNNRNKKNIQPNPRKEFMENVMHEIGILKQNIDQNLGDLQLVEEKEFEQEEESNVSHSIASSKDL